MGRQLYNCNEDSFSEIGFDIQLIDKHSNKLKNRISWHSIVVLIELQAEI